VSFYHAFGMVILAALLGGGSAGLMGFFIIGLRMPFLVIATAHAALAGAVFGGFFHLSYIAAGFAGALIGASLLGWLIRAHKVESNAALGTIFSLMMGLAFLGIGLSKGPKSAALRLLWGNLLFVTAADLWLMGVVLALLIVFAWMFNKELKLLLFSMRLADVTLPAGLLFTMLLLLEASVITINLETVGGLLLYSLVTNPAIAAMKLAKTYASGLLLSALLGAGSACGGFAMAFLLNLPVGACIVLSSSLLVAVVLWRQKMTKESV